MRVGVVEVVGGLLAAEGIEDVIVRVEEVVDVGEALLEVGHAALAGVLDGQVEDVLLLRLDREFGQPDGGLEERIGLRQFRVDGALYADHSVVLFRPVLYPDPGGNLA